MRTRTTIRVGGPADCVFAPADAEDASAFVQLCRRLKVPYEPIGAGSNLIVKDGGYRGALVDLGPSFGRVERVDTLRIQAGGGCPLPTVVARAREWGMAGCDAIAGIPGQVGGSVAMNAGTSDGDVSGVVESIVVVDRSGRVRTLPREEVPFEYRSFGLEKGTIVLEASFRFQTGDPKNVAAKVDASKAKRKASQPLDIPNAGCAFKNVRDAKTGKTKLFAGKVIEDLGLKGVRLRGAAVSEVHANFIVNVGNATARDVLGLQALVRDKVKEARGLTLESEWRVIGDDPPDAEEEP